jgi:uncharacterized membrane protein
MVMTYEQLALIHLGAVVPAVVLGTGVMLMPKGTPLHRLMGKSWMLLMIITALSSLFMPARVGPAVFGHFGVIHLLSVLVLALVPISWHAIRTGNVRRHRNNMIGLYAGGLLTAGTLAFMPGRMLHEWLFG